MAEVELTAVYKGDLKPGQTITVAYLDPYIVGDLDTRHRSFEHGDVLFLFLNPVTATEAFNRLPAGRTYHGVVESGVKLVQKNRVLTFVQLSEPWSLRVNTPITRQPLTVTAAKRAGVSTIHRQEAFLRWSKSRNGSRANDPSQMGRGCSNSCTVPNEGEINDFLKNLAVDRISDLHDLPLLKRAAALLPTGIYAGDLGAGYAFPESREYLLAQRCQPGFAHARADA